MKSAAEVPAPKFPMQVLLVEDSELNQHIVLRLLNEIGYRADVADSGFKALEAVKKNRYDLILMDVNMPELDGLEATRRIREMTISPSPIIIAMTGAAMEGDREKCLAAGMNDYVSKPFDPSEFQETIQSWSERINTGSAPGGTGVCQSGSDPVQLGVSLDGPPVNLQRMEQFSDGTPEGLRELIDLYLEQTAGYLMKLEHAIHTDNEDATRHFAHKGYGSSSICGMDALAQTLREIETEVTYRKTDSAPQLFAKARQEFEQVQTFLEAHLSTAR